MFQWAYFELLLGRVVNLDSKHTLQRVLTFEIEKFYLFLLTGEIFDLQESTPQMTCTHVAYVTMNVL